MPDLLNILIVVEDYPSIKNRYPMAYVHSRVVEYRKSDLVGTVSVLSFRADSDYSYEGVDVFCIKSVSKSFLAKFNRYVSHAPNVKNHVRFFIKNGLKSVVFFIHGHEVLPVNEYYPKEYSWKAKDRGGRFFRGFYDFFKLRIMKWFFTSSENFKFIFVSNWMKDVAYSSLKLKKELTSYVVYNPANSFFIENSYSPCAAKFDFITVRPLDGSKYCVDLVVQIAINNPKLKFKIIGKGEFFRHVDKPENVEWINAFLSPKELSLHLNDARFSLMPTRLDAQGVMMCELGVYGMPVVTSSIPIAREVFSGYENAFFIENDNAIESFRFNVLPFLDGRKIDVANPLRSRFDNKLLTDAELEIIVGEG